MVISTLAWEQVTIRYKEKLKDNIFKRATVSFNGETLSIQQSTGSSDADKSILLARPELISLSPWEMKWKAYWWSSEFGKPGFKDWIEAEVICKF